MASRSPRSNFPAAGMTRTSMDLPVEMMNDIRLSLLLHPGGPKTFKALVIKLLKEQLDRDAEAIAKLRELRGREGAKRAGRKAG